MTLQLYDNAARLTKPLKRVGERSSGKFEPIGWPQALDEIAERISRIVDEFGPRAVASYCGTYAFQNSAALAVARAWHHGLRTQRASVELASRVRPYGRKTPD